MTLTDFCKVAADDYGIVHLEVKDNTRIGVAELEEITRSIRRTHRPISSPILVKLGAYNSIDRDARDYLVQNKQETFLSACAFVVSCPASRVATELFLKMYRPNFPSGLFKSEKQAGKWLRSFAIALN